MKNRIFALFLALSVIFIFSCKNEPTNTPDYNLTKGATRSWKLYDLRGGENGQEVLYRDCNTDDSFDFLHNGKWYYQPGAKKCAENEALTQGSWAFNDAKTEINITAESPLAGNYKVTELSPNKLILSSKGRSYSFNCGCK